jgi:hypothetical protein
MESKIINPYSKIATEHAAGLNYIITNYIPPDEINFFTISDKIISLITEFMMEFENINLTNRKRSTEIHVFISFIFSNENNNFPQGIENNLQSERSKFYLNEIMSINVNMEYEKQLLILENIEKNISNAAIPVTDKNILYIITAVGSSSLKYWINQLQNGVKEWEDKFNGISALRWPWKEDAAGAAEGFITGAVGGFFGGSLGGPAGSFGGAVIGGIGGAIGGGIGASVKGIIKKWLHTD